MNPRILGRAGTLGLLLVLLASGIPSQAATPPVVQSIAADSLPAPATVAASPTPQKPFSPTGGPLHAGGPNPFGYTYLDSEELGGPDPTFEDISPIGTAITFDQGYYTLTLPFAFPFYDGAYSQAFVFADCRYCYTMWTHLAFGTPEPYAIGSIWWLDYVDRDSGTIYVYSDTLSNPARFIIQYDHVFNYSYGISTTSQVILYANGDILVRYAEDFDWWSSWYSYGTPYIYDPMQSYFEYMSAIRSNLAIHFYYPEGVWFWPPVRQGAEPAGGQVTYALDLYNSTGGDDSFTLVATGGLWPATITPTLTAVIPNGEAVPITITVTLPPGAAPGDVDGAVVQATSVSYPSLYTGTALLTTTALCTPSMAFAGQSALAASVDDTLEYARQGLTYMVIEAHAGTNNPSLHARVEARSRASGTWDLLGEWWNVGPDVRLVDRVDTPPLYDALHVVIEDSWGVWLQYNYHLVVCREPRAGLQPPAEAGFARGGEATTYGMTLTNWTLGPETFDLTTTGNAWPTTFWEGTTPITRVGPLADLESFTFTARVTVPAGVDPGTVDRAIVWATAVSSPAISATAVLSTTAIGDLAYVALSYVNQLALVDTASHHLVGTIDLAAAGCNYPYRVQMSPSGAFVYVSCNYSGNVLVVETAGDTVAGVVSGVPNAEGVAFTRDGAYALVTAGNQIAVIETAGRTIVQWIPLPTWVNRIAAHPYKDVAYAVGSGDTVAYVIDTAAMAVSTSIALGTQPCAVAVSPNGQWVFVGGLYGEGVLTVIDAATNQVYTTVTGLIQVYGLEVAPDSSELYACGGWDGVHVVDGDTFEVLATIPVANLVLSGAATDDGRELYVVGGESGGPALPIIDTELRVVTEQVTLPAPAIDVAIRPEVGPQAVFLSPVAQTGYAPLGTSTTYTTRLTNATGQTDNFTLTLAGNTWPATLSMTDTGPLSQTGWLTFTVQVTAPSGAAIGDTDTVTLHAASATSPTLFSDTATLTTWAVCTATMGFAGHSEETTGDLDDTYSYFNGQPFTHLYVYVHTDGYYLNATVSGYDSRSGDWVVLARQAQGRSGVLIDRAVPPVYTEVRVQLDDLANYPLIWYDYAFDVCRAPVVELAPAMQTGSGGAGETVAYSVTLTNWALRPERFRLAAVGQTWPITLSVTETDWLSDTARYTFTAWVKIPPGTPYPMSDTATLVATTVGAPPLTATAVLQTMTRPNRVAFMAASRELYGYWMPGIQTELASPPAGAPTGEQALLLPPLPQDYPPPGIRIIATEDGTDVSLVNLGTGLVEQVFHGLDRYATRDVFPSPGTYFKVVANKPVLAYEQRTDLFGTFIPSLESGPVGNEFIVEYFWNSGFYVFAIEDAVVNVYDTAGNLVASQTMGAGTYWSPYLNFGDIYHMTSTGKIALQQTTINNDDSFTIVPAADGDGLGRLFYFAVTGYHYAGMVVFAYDDARVQAYDMDTGDLLAARAMRAGDYWWEPGIGIRRVRLVSSGQVEVWTGSSATGTLPDIGDDISAASGWDGRFFHLHTLSYGAVIFAPFNGTDLLVDGTSYHLDRDEYLQLPAGEYLRIASTRPVLIQTFSNYGGWSTFGSYLGGVHPGLVPAQVYILPQVQFRGVAPAHSVVYEEWLFNALDREESFTLTAASGWPASLSLDQTGPLAAGQWITFSLQVTVPAGVGWYDTDVATVQATAHSSPTLYATAVISTQVYVPPQMTVAPLALTATVAAEQTATRTLAIANGYGVSLTFSLEERPGRPFGSPASPTRILAWPTYAPEGYYQNALDALATYYINFTLEETTVISPTQLAAALAGKDVFLIPAQSYAYPYDLISIGSAWASVLQDFVARGGTVIALDSDDSWHILQGAGLVSTNFRSSVDYNTLQVALPGHRLAAGVSSYFQAPYTTVSYYTANGDWVITDQSSGYPVVVARDIGQGHVVLMGFNYASYNDDTARLLANAVQWPATDVPWLSEEPVGGTVATSSTLPVQVTFDAAGLGPAIYAATLRVYSDDPLQPIVHIPVTMTVTPAAAADVGVDKAAPGTVRVNDTFAYQVAYTNAGPSLAEAVVLTDTLPAGVLYVADNAPFAHSGSGNGPIIWHGGDWPAGTAGTFAVTVTLVTGTPGMFITNTVQIAARDGAGNPGDDQATARSAIVCQPLVAAFQPLTAVVTAGTALTWTNASTGSLPLAFLWAFGDGSVSTATNPMHTYTSPGSYPVLLTVTDPCAGQEIATGTVTVTCRPLTAAFVPTFTAVLIGEPVTFTQESTGTAPLSFRWDFDDGVTSTLPNPVHAYTAAGVYAVTLTVADLCGHEEIATGTVTVTCRPLTAAFVPTFTAVLIGEPVTFTQESTGTAPLSFRWDFDDGVTSTLPNPVHTYTAAGVYAVTLTVADLCGHEEIATGTVQVARRAWVIYLPLVMRSAGP